MEYHITKKEQNIYNDCNQIKIYNHELRLKDKANTIKCYLWVVKLIFVSMYLCLFKLF